MQVATILLSQSVSQSLEENAILEFLLNEDKAMSIRLVNALGQTIAVLSDRELHTSGLHKVEINGNSLTTGIYHVVLEGENFKEMHKVSVIK